jgi:hypothetical protein
VHAGVQQTLPAIAGSQSSPRSSTPSLQRARAVEAVVRPSTRASHSKGIPLAPRRFLAMA